ncbi:MAG TPA: orotidine-5'-phosphate decarboxylase [Pyrinomonadaceae bacterium]|nr:orotidine-5'-phosphate decarboxylase [Pyrinomonadaceae bacterium]
MAKTMHAMSPDQETRNRVIVALDVETRAEAAELVSELGGRAGAFKIGLQLFTSAGPDVVREIVTVGHRVFLDLKFHDIPNTAAKAAIEAARLGVWMLNLHALGGRAMMTAVADEVARTCENEGIDRPLLIGVTALTSSDAASLSEVGLNSNVEEQVSALARLAAASGMDGVVASAREVPGIRRAVEDQSFLTITPGIRSEFATADDQKRVTTIREAFANGSDYVVVGRPIIRANDRVAALESLIDEAGSTN